MSSSAIIAQGMQVLLALMSLFQGRNQLLKQKRFPVKVKDGIVESSLTWYGHTASWEKPSHTDGVAKMDIVGSKKGRWVSIHSLEVGENSQKLTILNLDEHKSNELLHTILETFHHNIIILADECARLNRPKGKNPGEIGAGKLNYIIDLAQAILKGRRIQIED